MEASEQEILARVRTFLALERNYLAEERTVLAEFRTGLTLALIGPPASGVVTYMIPEIPAEAALLFLTFLLVITAFGIWTSADSRSRLKKIRRKRRILKDREIMTIRRSRAVYDLLGDFIVPDDKQ